MIALGLIWSITSVCSMLDWYSLNEGLAVISGGCVMSAAWALTWSGRTREIAA
jgi:hypothetical protein